MMSATRPDIDAILTHVAESLDISPTDYERAVRSYGGVGKWLEDGFENDAYPESKKKPCIYPQGSINLGTIVRPIKDGNESDFDVDLVCELQASRVSITPNITKKVVRQTEKQRYVSKQTRPRGKAMLDADLRRI